MFTSVQCSTVATCHCVIFALFCTTDVHSVTSLCDGLNLRKKQVCLHSLALCAYISRRTRIFHEFAFDNKALKTFVKFRICWKCSQFFVELWHLRHGLLNTFIRIEQHNKRKKNNKESSMQHKLANIVPLVLELVIHQFSS